MDIARPDAEEVMAAAHPRFVILVGKDMVAPAGQRFGQQQTDRLHPLPRFPAHHEVDFSGHPISPISSLRSNIMPSSYHCFATPFHLKDETYVILFSTLSQL